jgi:hypothetical protein
VSSCALEKEIAGKGYLLVFTWHVVFAISFIIADGFKKPRLCVPTGAS